MTITNQEVETKNPFRTFGHRFRTPQAVPPIAEEPLPNPDGEPDQGKPDQKGIPEETRGGGSYIEGGMIFQDRRGGIFTLRDGFRGNIFTEPPSEDTLTRIYWNFIADVQEKLDEPDQVRALGIFTKSHFDSFVNLIIKTLEKPPQEGAPSQGSESLISATGGSIIAGDEALDDPLETSPTGEKLIQAYRKLCEQVEEKKLLPNDQQTAKERFLERHAGAYLSLTMQLIGKPAPRTTKEEN